MTNSYPGETGSPASAAVDGAEGLAHGSPNLPGSAAPVKTRVSQKFIWLVTLAIFGNFMAIVAPVGFSLAVRMSAIDSAHTSYLGYVTGIGALSGVIFAPIVGTLSDRTRSRLGRRRPWIIAMTIVGLVGLTASALAPTFGLLIVGWCIAQFGLGSAQLQIINMIVDRVPDEQRGRISGLTGVAQMVASVLGTAVAAAFASQALLLFLVPGGIGAILMMILVIVVREDDSRTSDFGPRVPFTRVIAGYGYNVRKYRDFSFNWIGRFAFNFAVTLATTFTTLFFAERLHIPVASIGGVVALSGVVGVAATAGGAALSGFLSDRLRRRKIFIGVAAILLAVGALLLVTAHSFPALLVGSFILNLGLGVFFAVDQAVYLSVLPEADTQGGRFVGINQFSTLLPQVIGPVLAPTLLLIGGTSASGNYSLLYYLAAGLAIVGSAVIMFAVKSVR